MLDLAGGMLGWQSSSRIPRPSVIATHMVHLISFMLLVDYIGKRERERKREREKRERGETDRQTDRETDRHRQKEREREERGCQFLT